MSIYGPPFSGSILLSLLFLFSQPPLYISRLITDFLLLLWLAGLFWLTSLCFSSFISSSISGGRFPLFPVLWCLSPMPFGNQLTLSFWLSTGWSVYMERQTLLFLDAYMNTHMYINSYAYAYPWPTHNHTYKCFHLELSLYLVSYISQSC